MQKRSLHFVYISVFSTFLVSSKLFFLRFSEAFGLLFSGDFGF